MLKCRNSNFCNCRRKGNFFCATARKCPVTNFGDRYAIDLAGNIYIIQVATFAGDGSGDGVKLQAAAADFLLVVRRQSGEGQAQAHHQSQQQGRDPFCVFHVSLSLFFSMIPKVISASVPKQLLFELFPKLSAFRVQMGRNHLYGS